jgi:serine/threonine-protein kinase
MLDADRLPGSTRFMAQEEFVRGSTIDQTTNVFTLGRAAAEFLGGGQASHETWRASPGLLNVIHRAIQPDRAQRYPSVADFVDAWQAERNS